MLLTNLQSLQVVLAAAVATTQPVLYAGWADHTTTTFTPNSATTTTNSTTAVTWVAAPAASTVRQAKYLSLYNADSAAVTATVRVNDNGTFRTLSVVTLLPGDQLEYRDGEGFVVHATTTSPFVLGNGFKNYLISGDYSINQRSFAGGALAAGVYGFDRWKAGTGGCNVSLSGGVLTHTSGPLVQVIEAPRLNSELITVSVEDPSGSITVNVDGQTGTITAGSGRRGVQIIVPAGSTGNVTLTLTATGVTYKRVQLARGADTSFEWRPAAIEMLLAERYFQASKSYASGAYWTGQVTSGSAYAAARVFATQMRASPSVTLSAKAGVNFDTTTISTIDADACGFRFQGTANGTGAGTMLAQFSADAEL